MTLNALKIIFRLAALVAVCVCLIFFVQGQYVKSVTPPPNMNALSADAYHFYANFPTNGVTMVRPKEMNVWASFAVPSGRATYVYDSDGMLIDWTPDSGNGGTFNKKWNVNALRNHPEFQQ